jgi:enamine deaminase RidA (YjgF/YER057c/UK114 family)
VGTPEEALARLGLELPPLQQPVANYVSAVRTGDLLFLAGAGPAVPPGGKMLVGKLGRDLSVEEGYEAARSVGLVQIARLKDELGELSRVVRIVKLLAMVNSTPDFTDHPTVINGCSDLLVEVFGDAGRHARSAVGMANLPFGIPVEIEMIVEVAD